MRNKLGIWDSFSDVKDGEAVGRFRLQAAANTYPSTPPFISNKHLVVSSQLGLDSILGSKYGGVPMYHIRADMKESIIRRRKIAALAV